jgi:hypothetical protein
MYSGSVAISNCYRRLTFRVQWTWFLNRRCFPNEIRRLMVHNIKIIINFSRVTPAEVKDTKMQNITKRISTSSAGEI